MKHTKLSLTGAIIILAERIDKGDAYKALFDGNISSLPELAKQIIYDLFVYNYNEYIEKDDKVFYAYKMLKEYASELNEYGDVHFGVNYNGKNYRKQIIYQQF